MKLPFYKYQGTGNDFVIVNGIELNLNSIEYSVVKYICDRRFGIGADGLMIISKSKDFDFEMIYYNSDGGLSTMCGNGGRCISHLAHNLGIAGDKVKFLAADGPHFAVVDGSLVALGMRDVFDLKNVSANDYITNTGSPHYVRISDDQSLSDIVTVGKSVRYSRDYADEGINVNLISWNGNILKVATYERGVEDETLSCGTGVTASALVASVHFGVQSPIKVSTKGGDLVVSFNKNDKGFSDVILSGPAELVFKGEIEI
ncbi:MAG: diaminopimelate epimerase [Saprospiraceae bacterium]